MQGVLEYLYSKFPKVRQEQKDNANVNCPFCGEGSDKRGRLYVNIDPSSPHYGLFFCHLCGEKGNYNKLRRQFGDPPIDEDAPNFTVDRRKSDLLEAAVDYYNNCLLNTDEAALNWMRNRGFTWETIDRFKLGWADGSLRPILAAKGFSTDEMIDAGLLTRSGVDFFRDCFTIPYVRGGRVVLIRGRYLEGDSKYKAPAGSEAMLFNSDVTYGADELLVCEGEFDAIAATQAGFAAVGVPGVTSWKKNWGIWEKYLSFAKRIHIVFDADNAGREAATLLANAIGARASIVDLGDGSDNKIDLNDWLYKLEHSPDELRLLFIKSRGGLLVTVQDSYDEWLNDQGENRELKFGIDELDRSLQRGILPGQVIVVLAKTGAGKSIASLNLFHRISMCQPDAKILFVSLEQTRAEWFDRAWKIHRFYRMIGDPQQAQMETIDYWKDRIMLVDKNRVSEEELVDCIDRYQYEFGQKPDLVCVDYLGYWSRSYKGEAYERTSAAIMAMKAIAKDLRVRFLAPHQVSRSNDAGEELDLNSARDSGAVEETADFLFSLWREDMRKGREIDNFTGLTSMRILKSRHGGVNRRANLIFAPYSLTMIPQDESLAEFAKHENYYNSRGDDYEIAFQRHLTGDRVVRIVD